VRCQRRRHRHRACRFAREASANDATSRVTTSDVDGHAGLEGVSCLSTGLCVAGDSRGDVVTSTNPTGGANAWTQPADIDGTNQLMGVSCASATLCVAVDYVGNIVVGEG
jgi:hypothetical protein